MLFASRRMSFIAMLGLAAAVPAGAGLAPAHGTEFVLVYAFQGGTDGDGPLGSLIGDKAGNLYGTTSVGGGTGCQGSGCGTVFKIAADGSENVLYAFQGGNDGADPFGALASDAGGNLYGSTGQGGDAGAGTVFKLAPDGTETALYAFQGGKDGAIPEGNLLADANGDLFGVTYEGGNLNGSCAPSGCGTVFELQPGNSKTTLYAFKGGSDGQTPYSVGLIADASGNLYGTTAGGGNNNINPSGCGTVFKVAPDGSETVLYAFKGGNDGCNPLTGVIADSTGNLYGTTVRGGGTNVCLDGCGTVFRLSPKGKESVLHAFQISDGLSPQGSLIRDGHGNLYGTTLNGGMNVRNCGTVFKLAPDGSETVLHSFHKRDGCLPAVALLKGTNGLLYGTASEGGTRNNGAVYRVKR